MQPDRISLSPVSISAFGAESADGEHQLLFRSPNFSFFMKPVNSAKYGLETR